MVMKLKRHPFAIVWDFVALYLWNSNVFLLDLCNCCWMTWVQIKPLIEL